MLREDWESAGLEGSDELDGPGEISRRAQLSLFVRGELGRDQRRRSVASQRSQLACKMNGYVSPVHVVRERSTVIGNSLRARNELIPNPIVVSSSQVRVADRSNRLTNRPESVLATVNLIISGSVPRRPLAWARDPGYAAGTYMANRPPVGLESRAVGHVG